MKGDREVVREAATPKQKKSWFPRRGSKKDTTASIPPSRPPSAMSKAPTSPRKSNEKGPAISVEDDELPERMEFAHAAHPPAAPSPTTQPRPESPRTSSDGPGPARVGFDFAAIHDVIAQSGGSSQADADVLHAPVAQSPHAALSLAAAHEPSGRAESAPPPYTEDVTDAVPAVPSVPSHLRPSGVRARLASTPYIGPSGEFEADGFDEDAPEVAVRVGEVEGRGVPFFSGSGTSTMGTDRYLPSAFAQSVSLEPGSSRSASQIYAKAGVSAADSTTDQLSYWSRRDADYGSSIFGGASAGNGWSNGSASSARAASQEPAMSFGGPAGSVWDAPTASNASVPSLSFAPISSAPPPLPVDILNPFADPSSGGGSDDWTPPPLTTKTSSNANSASTSGSTRARRSTLNVNLNANPWD